MNTACEETDFRFHSRNSNLFFVLNREPDAGMLERMSACLDTYGPRDVRLFLDVRGLSCVSDAAITCMRSWVRSSALPPQRVYYKGEAGFRLGTDGNRVIVARKAGEARADPEALRRFKKRHAKGHPCHCGGKGHCCHGDGHCCGHHHDGEAHEATVLKKA